MTPPLYYDLFLFWLVFALLWLDPLSVPAPAPVYHWKEMQ